MTSPINKNGIDYTTNFTISETLIVCWICDVDTGWVYGMNVPKLEFARFIVIIQDFPSTFPRNMENVLTLHFECFRCSPWKEEFILLK